MLKSMRKLVPTDKELDKVRLNITTQQLDAGNYHVFQGNPMRSSPWTLSGTNIGLMS